MYFYESILEEYKYEGMNMVWTMREGGEIMLKDMCDDHIQKCINMLKRNGLKIVKTEWIEVFEDVKIKRRVSKLTKIINEIKINNKT